MDALPLEVTAMRPFILNYFGVIPLGKPIDALTAATCNYLYGTDL